MSRASICMCALAVVSAAWWGVAFAQEFPTDKGSCQISGGFSFSSAGGDLYEEDGERLTQVAFNPAVTYFVAPGLGIGGALALTRLSQGDASLTSWGLGPQVIYYFGGKAPRAEVKGKIYPYAGWRFLYTKLSSGGEDASGITNAFGGGALSMLTETVGLFGELAYNIDDIEDVGGNKINLGAGFTFFLY